MSVGWLCPSPPGSVATSSGRCLINARQPTQHLVQSRGRGLGHDHLEHGPPSDVEELLGTPHTTGRPAGQDYTGGAHQASIGRRYRSGSFENSASQPVEQNQ
jgi:hypothetical protein